MTIFSNTQTIPLMMPAFGRRSKTIAMIVFCLTMLISIISMSFLMGDSALAPQLELRNSAPSLSHPFGTDWMGRDMVCRTLKGLSLSLFVGLSAATFSALVGTIIGICAAVFGGIVDLFISWLIDLFMSLPHLLLLILISFAAGGGVRGVVIGVTVSHWTGIARIIRAEILQLKQAEFIQLSSKLGRSPLWIAKHHLIPHIVPQFLVGLILMFPHAILHEAGLTFIGFGLSPHEPAIGIILSESMRYLSTGYWWLAVLPGLSLLFAVKFFDILGENLRLVLNPKTSQE